MTPSFRAPTLNDLLGTLPAACVTAPGEAVPGGARPPPASSDIAKLAAAAMEEEEELDGLAIVLFDKRCAILDMVTVD